MQTKCLLLPRVRAHVRVHVRMLFGACLRGGVVWFGLCLLSLYLPAWCVCGLPVQGFGGLYKGLPMELFRGVLSGALLLVVKERMDILSKRILLGGASSRIDINGVIDLMTDYWDVTVRKCFRSVAGNA